MSKQKDPARKSSAPGSDSAERWLTREEAAAWLQVSYRTFCRWEKDTPIPGAKVEAGRMVYPESELEDFRAAHEDDIRDGLSKLQHEVVRGFREAADHTRKVNESSAAAISVAASSLGGMSDTLIKGLSQMRRENKRMAKALEKRDLMIGLVFEAMQAFFAVQQEQQRLTLEREREALLSRERTQVMVEGFKMALPGIVHLFAPSKTTTVAGMATIFGAMNEDQRGRLMTLVGELPAEAQATAGALLQSAIEQLEAKEKKAEGPGVAKAEPRAA